MKLALMERFDKVMKSRIPEYSDSNKPVNSLVVNYILSHIEHELVMRNSIKVAVEIN